ncbi:unnamed protein product [Diabrotica balteata]|uniref:Uncharacterized protein n=1 Tax=Diabrotica balteata TaxID=107213 RepID=A0A9N9XG46_DIABA|nr:unnamed protein product [Diabrotica balteata]
MDSLKLMASTRNHLDQMLKTVETFSNENNTQHFGLDKCRVLNIVKGKVQPGGFDMQNGQNIEAMGENDMYKYLGVKQVRKIDHKQMKIELTSKVYLLFFLPLESFRRTS